MHNITFDCFWWTAFWYFGSFVVANHSLERFVSTKLFDNFFFLQLSITDIKAEMEKTLHWLVPVATNTAK